MPENTLGSNAYCAWGRRYFEGLTMGRFGRTRVLPVKELLLASGQLGERGENSSVTLFTSGSTGVPKRIVKTVRQLELEAEIVDRVRGACGRLLAATVGTPSRYRGC